MRVPLVFSSLLTILVAGVFASRAELAWREITEPPALALPRDHGAHPETRTEWWYVTGLVTDEAGRRYGFQITFFRQGLSSEALEPGSSRLRARQVAAAHLAVADIEAGGFHHAERLRRAAGGLAGWSETDLDVWLENWTMQRAEDDTIAIRARDPETGIGLELELRPEKALVLQGNAGYSQKGESPGNASAYLSWTRLSASGSLEVGGSTTEVDGGAWFDHEWGTSQLGKGVAGWDWFSFRLEDGRDLMVYRLRRTDGSADPFSSGTVVAADGGTSKLGRDDVEIEALEWWDSPASGGRYPVRWRIKVPGHGIDLDVRGLLPASELDGSATTGVVYWEGPIDAIGSARGEGYAELTGYAGSLEGLF
jgi:predicted secreted hydrolase